MTGADDNRTATRTVIGMSVAALLFGVLAVWSALNPGYYYLGRAALFIVLGATCAYIAAKPLTPRQAPTLSLLYVAVVLSVAAVIEVASSPAGQVESLSVFLVPLILTTTVAAAFTWLARRR